MSKRRTPRSQRRLASKAHRHGLGRIRDNNPHGTPIWWSLEVAAEHAKTQGGVDIRQQIIDSYNGDSAPPA